MTSELKSAKCVQFGQVDGYSYVLFNSKSEFVTVSRIRFGQPDKEIDNQINKRKKGRYNIPKSCYKESPWTKWLDIRRKTPSEYSIMEHKGAFRGKLPVYAKSFRDQGISSFSVDNDRYKVAKLVPNGTRDNWRFERELLIPEKNIGKKVIVERIYGWNGEPRKVTLIHLLKDDGMLEVHEENKIGKGKWERTTRLLGNNNYASKTWPTFRDLPNIWSKYF